MCTNEKSCIMINCGCCGNGSGITPEPTPASALKYMQVYADDQTDLVIGKKIYFNDKSFGDFEITPSGTMIVSPGIYFMFLNCQITHEGTSGYLSLNFHDLINNKNVGRACSRVSPDNATHTSCSDGACIEKFTEPVEICINSIYVSGNPRIEDVYGSIIQIA